MSRAILKLVVVAVIVGLSDSANLPISSSLLPPNDSELELLLNSKILMDHPSSHLVPRDALKFPKVEKDEVKIGNNVVEDETSEVGKSSVQNKKFGEKSGKVQSEKGNKYEMSSPFHLARCRATCLEKFNEERTMLKGSSESGQTNKVDPNPSSPSASTSTFVNKKKWSCLETSDCLECWKSCEKFEGKRANDPITSSESEGLHSLGGINEATKVTANSPGKDYINGKSKQSIACSDSKCVGGCQVACSFYQRKDLEGKQEMLKKDPVVAKKHESVVKIVPGEMTWSLPSVLEKKRDSAAPPLVYMVIQEYPDGKWRQIAQTIETNMDIPKELTSAMSSKLKSVRVLVVGPDGLQAVLRPQVDKTVVDKSSSKIRATTVETTTELESSTVAEAEATIPFHVSGPFSFELRIVSLIHQKSLVIAELKWDAVGPNPSQEYLITWELTEGGLKGHLVTDSTSVTLSLWPDTTYQIQVEEFHQNLDSDGEQPAENSATSLKSLPIIVDTGMASFPLGSAFSLPSTDYEQDEYPEQSGNDKEEKPAHKSFMNFTNFSLVLCLALSSTLLVLIILAITAYIWTRLGIKKEKSNFSAETGCCDTCHIFFPSEKEPQLLQSQDDFIVDSSLPFKVSRNFITKGYSYSLNSDKNKVGGYASAAILPVAVISSDLSSERIGGYHPAPYYHESGIQPFSAACSQDSCWLANHNSTSTNNIAGALSPSSPVTTHDFLDEKRTFRL